MNETLKEMKGSEFHKIVAAVLEVVEKALTEPQKDVTIQETSVPNVWKMVSLKGTTSLDELNGIKTELGKNFSVTVAPKSAQMLVITIEAANNDFMELLKRQPSGTFEKTRPF